ncbi:MAG: outer membrane protein transport protein [Myxococcales bacterium]|nr:outer membrane protein transport protein [Myxococcales bacterium]
MSFTSSRPVALVTAGLVLVAGSARASGFYFGDNGAKAMMQGGAFTAQADDLTAIMYNPAGLAQLDGWSFAADVQLLNHQVNFLRQDPGFDPANPNTLVNTVDNGKSGLFFLPFLGGSYGFKVAGRTLTVSLGVYGPPSQGRYVFPAPNYTKEMSRYLESPRRFSPQRYSLISNDIIILYPSLSLAYAIHPRFMVGASAQLVVSHFTFKQAISADPTNPMTQLAENPEFDALVDVNVSGQVGFTGIFGVLARPLDWLSLGASVRPPIPMKATGSLGIAVTPELSALARVQNGAGESCAPADPSQASPCRATLEVTLPLELKFGVRATPYEGLGINADFVYQGWQSVDQFLLTPQDVNMVLGGMTTPVEPFAIPKRWNGSFSGRLGASYDVIKYLTVHAGFLFETGAAPPEYYAIDFAHPTRVMVTGGVTGHLGPIDVLAGIAWAPNVQSVITQSEVRRGSTDPTTPAGVVGAGIYNSGGFSILLGVRGRFPPKPKVAEAEPPAAPAPASTPAPAPEAAPAATPTPTTPAKETTP